MANDVENALKQVAQKIAAYVEGAAELVVETRYSQVVSNTEAASAGGAAIVEAVASGEKVSEAVKYAREHSRFAAVTIIQLDGDSLSVVPVQQATTGNLTLDAELLAEHQVNVKAASEYRARILEALVGLLSPRARQL
ncbi:MAG TPA: hypothetical protein VNL77_07545 [Roseiflexaceae bacterium]|nr:hypothetical protein [Roseiflexaceae bacterium]